MSKMVIQTQKGKSVISTMILILFLICFFSSYSQDTFSDTYCIDYDLMDFSTCITFETKNTFKYSQYGDTGRLKYGEGEYKHQNNRLILNYNKTSAKSIGHYSLSVYKNNSDSIRLIVSVFNTRTNEPIEYANVFFKDSINNLGYTGSSANADGLVEIRTSKNKNNIELNVIYLGFIEQKINLIRDKNYKIKVYLKEQADESGMPILNQIDTLEIVKIRPKYFTVKRKDGNIATWRKLED